MSTNQLTDDGLALIKSFEGLRLEAYQDGGGVWTIGFGHVYGVKMGDTCTADQADKWLETDLIDSEYDISVFVTAALNDNQFSALVSLVFNCGPAPLHGHLGAYLNSQEFDKAADQFLVWNHDNGKVVDGLTRRRKAERKLFLTPTT